MSSNNNANNEKKTKLFDGVLLITSILCLIPLIFGIIIWNRLPEQIPVHFDINGIPNSYTGKTETMLLFALLGFGLNLVLNLIVNLVAREKGIKLKLLSFLKWFAPVICFFCSGIIYMFALGFSVNTSFWAQIFVGFIIIILGNLFPKIPSSMANIPVDEKAFTIWKRITGRVFFATGLLIFITSIFPFGIYILFCCIPIFLIMPLLFVIKVKKD